MKYTFHELIQVAAINLIGLFDSALAADLYILVLRERTIEFIVRHQLPKWKIRLAVFIKFLPTWFWILSISGISSILFVIFKTTIPLDIGGVIVSVIAFYFGITKNPEALLLKHLEKAIIRGSNEGDGLSSHYGDYVKKLLCEWPDSGESFRKTVYLINCLELLLGFIITGIGIWLEIYPFRE